MLKFTDVTLRNNTLVAAAVFAHEQAQLFCFDQASCSPGLTVSNKGCRDLISDPLLVCEPMADRIDHPGDAPKAMQTPSRQIGNVCYTSKRQQVVRTNTMDSDATNDHHIFLSIIEAHTQRLGRINVVAVK
ncbi:hypothetical protein BLA6863_05626 [Burkholderia lata]|uniref:Uncharacterized protein n=1 Tax=Burkholderia lata (strain ATCC 17760 / DSM 23089 / LMG 22485 / NCIMB 9086 / R18194 / 383) TaxID=482957 RepID=A0A6P2Q143_BURL3|nr:hypothetical protein BLA6863_05626 [Burkholderia lata]